MENIDTAEKKLYIIIGQLDIFLNEFLMVELKRNIHQYVLDEKKKSESFKPSENLIKIIEKCKDIKRVDERNKVFKSLYIETILKTIDRMDLPEFKIKD